MARTKTPKKPRPRTMHRAPGRSRSQVRTGSREKVDQEHFLSAHRISDEDFRKSRCAWEDLEWIYTLHHQSHDTLSATATYISDCLRQVDAVHSLKVRIKDAEHLLEKIVRKKVLDPKRIITPENYKSEITDLIGIRALHLFKDGWYPIHQFVSRTWTLCEEPLAYYRDGDPSDLITSFADAGCNTREHPAGYRSVHYLLKCQPTKEVLIAELQVRTVFEEGWSEIDHIVRYPYVLDDAVLNKFLVLFNRTAGIADEMGSFLQRLRADHEKRQRESDAAVSEQQGKISSLEAQVAKLKISDAQRQKLEKELAALRKAQAESSPVGSSVFSGASWTTLGVPSVAANVGVTFPSLTERVSSLLSPQRRCSVCGKTFTSVVSSVISDRCPECWSKRPVTGLGITGR